MKILVVGVGYVGLVMGVCLANTGNDVTCVDANEDKIKLLNQGKSPIFEPGLEELMETNKSRLTFSLTSEQVFKDQDIIMICVGTPERRDGSADLTYLYQVVDDISKYANTPSLVVVKSTVPIGINDEIEEQLNKSKNISQPIHVASNPEFLSQGTAVKDTLYPSRIIIGANDEAARKTLSKLYENFDAPVVITDRRSAEMIKYASNDFLALKISYINEIANLCELVGADINDVAKGMGYDERIGNKFLKAGIGYGGSCFPKDTKALHWLAAIHDYEIKTIKAAIEVNEQQKLVLIKKARKYYPNFKNLKVAVLGLTFKPNTDDLRDAPSLAIIPCLLDEEAQISVYDPIGLDAFKKLYPEGIYYANSIDEAVKDAQLCLVLTEWPQFTEYDPQKLCEIMQTPIILDGRNCLDSKALLDLGAKYEAIGRVFE